MIKFNLVYLSLFLTSVAAATPGEFTLIRPTWINHTESSINAKVNIPCSNTNALDWGSIVTSYDDAGDKVTVVGILWPKSHCSQAGLKAGETREFTLSVDHEFATGDSVEPMDIAK